MESVCINLKRPMITGESDGGGDETLSKKPHHHHHPPTRSRLSELPDLALVHVLSHLQTEEAARTSVLSKRFNSLWNSVDSLSFDGKYSGRNGTVFVESVDAALRFHRRKFIEKFVIKVDYWHLMKDSVDQWIKFAVEKQVKSIHLNFPDTFPQRAYSSGCMYTLPKILYKNANLTELVTRGCIFKMTGKINCSRLKFLSISRTRLNHESISRILGGCNVLQTLELHDFTGFDKLKIDSGSSLRVLRIVGEQPPNHNIEQGEDYVLEISGPGLVCLEVSGILYRTKLRLVDLGGLVNAVITFTVFPKGNRYESAWFAAKTEELAKDVLESLCLVSVVTFGGIILQALTAREAYNLSSPWSERRHLTLCIPIVQWSHLSITSLLHSSPYLESLVIKLSYCSDTCVLEHAEPLKADSKHYWNSWSTISKCRLQHLKTVKIVGFQVSCQSIEPIFVFLEFLLKNAEFLEEITIQASRYVTRAALDEAMKLLSVVTSSPDVVVQFEPPHFWVDPLWRYNGRVPLFLG